MTKSFPHAQENTLQIIRGLTGGYGWYHYNRMHEKYGDSYTAVFPKQALVTQDPKLLKYIMHTNSKNYTKPGNENPFFKEIFELTYNQNNLFFANDFEFWKKSRKAATAYFLQTKLKDYFPKMVQMTEEAAKELDAASNTDKPVNIREILATMTLKNMLYNLFDDCDVDAHQFHHQMNTALSQIALRASSLNRLRWLLPTKDRSDWKSSYSYVKGAAIKIVEDRKKSSKIYDDLLSGLMTTYEDIFEGNLVQESLVGDMLVYLIAGHDTTASTLNAVFKYLSLYPEVEQKIQMEIENVVGDNALQFEHIDQLTYTKMVFHEALRLQTPISIVTRVNLEDDEFEGIPIPKGSNILLNLSGANRNTDYWQNPEAFDPERFRDKRWGQDEQYAYVPFAGGPRMCIGMNFAILEAVIALALLVPRFKPTLIPGRLRMQELDLTSWPKGAEEMVIHKRT